MQQTIKWVFLFVLIGMPVSIYFFLQAFGENKFEIPVFYENGIENRVEGCDPSSDQYYVPALKGFDSLLMKYSEEIWIYDIGQVKSNELLQKDNQITVLNEKLDQRKRVSLYSSNLKSKKLLDFARCGLNLNANLHKDSTINNNMLVLVDTDRRIRGYYKVLDREDLDRLIVEVDILLKE